MYDTDDLDYDDEDDGHDKKSKKRGRYADSISQDNAPPKAQWA